MGIPEDRARELEVTDTSACGEPASFLISSLPRSDLLFREEGVKVTISLSKRSVDVLQERWRAGTSTQYQRMIRRLLDAYAAHRSRSDVLGARAWARVPC